jgi:hypothetical protein
VARFRATQLCTDLKLAYGQPTRSFAVYHAANDMELFTASLFTDMAQPADSVVKRRSNGPD